MSAPSNTPQQTNSSKKKWWIGVPTTLAAGSVAAILAMSGCGEDKDSSGTFIQNSEAQSLHNIDTSNIDNFLEGTLKAVNSTNPGTNSDVVQEFDNLHKFIQISMKGRGERNKVRCTYNYDDRNGQPSYVEYGFSAGKEDGYDVVSIRYIGENVVDAQGAPIDKNIVLRKSPSTGKVYKANPNGPRNNRIELKGGDIREIIKNAVPF